MIESLASQNYSKLSENGVNQQIQQYQVAQHTYLAASAYFDRADIALPGFSKFFHERAEHEGHMCQRLVDYQATRGGVVILGPLPQSLTDWKSAIEAIEICLVLEKDVNESLINMTISAYKNGDKHLKHELKSGHLKYKVETIENVVKGHVQLERVGKEGLGLYLLDQDLYKHEKFVV